jgi:hypothetical protein
MFVVKVETDEAPAFRAFWRSQAAKDWALQRSLDDAHCSVAVFRAVGIRDAIKAVEAVRDGRATLLFSGEKLQQQNFRERSCMLAGMGIGTGAGF